MKTRRQKNEEFWSTVKLPDLKPAAEVEPTKKV